MFFTATGGLPLSIYQQMQKDYPGGKGLFGMMQLAKAKFEEDKAKFAEAQRAEGDAGTVSYSYMGEFESEPEPEATPTPMAGPFGAYGLNDPMRYATGSPMRAMLMQQQAYNKTTGGDPDFQAWLASQYGNNN